jgi:hypothetical protein
MKFFTGVGSRQTPPDVLALMTRAARFLRTEGWTLRSGHATGADWAFEQGAGADSVIYLPWPKFGQEKYGDDPGRPVLGTPVHDKNRWAANFALLVKLGLRAKGPWGPAKGVDMLHGRNVAQVLGMPGDPPSKFVIAWCPEVNGKPQGGTATALLLAQHEGIPVFNLYRPEDRKKIEHRLAIQESH